MTTDKPLIFTTKGNLPAADLTHEVDWKVTPEQIVFIETYKLGDEVVKQSSHVKLLIGAAAVGEASI